MNRASAVPRRVGCELATTAAVVGRARRVKRSEVLRLRLQEAEWQGLRRLSDRTGINQSRLARKALRELVTGGVDLLEREQQQVLVLSRSLRSLQSDLKALSERSMTGDEEGAAVLEQLSRLQIWCAESDLRWRGLIAAARARTVPEHGRP